MSLSSTMAALIIMCAGITACGVANKTQYSAMKSATDFEITLIAAGDSTSVDCRGANLTGVQCEARDNAKHILDNISAVSAGIKDPQA